MKGGKYQEAIEKFIALGDYKTTKEKIKTCEVKLMTISKVGDEVTFGYYGKENIVWKVLEKKQDKVLLISKEGVDFVEYSSDKQKITWDKCSLRTWMNDSFFNNAFSKDEQNVIETTVVTDNYYFDDHSTRPGKDTKDKVFVLSINQLIKYFGKNDFCRQLKPTAYADSKGVFIDGDGNVAWWLRACGDDRYCISYVNEDGSVHYYGFDGRDANDGSVSVRPALWINLEP